MQGTVKSLTDQALFVSLEGSVDAVVWSHHISDIKLKHAERKFKPGVVVKGRVSYQNCRSLKVIVPDVVCLARSSLSTLRERASP